MKRRYAVTPSRITTRKEFKEMERKRRAKVDILDQQQGISCELLSDCIFDIDSTIYIAGWFDSIG